MNTLIEARSAGLRLPSRQANQFNPAILQVSMQDLREKFAAFNQSLDLTPIKYKLMKDKDWTLDRANQVEPQYKAFLFLIGSKVRAEFVPTFDIDEMWHTHILDTRKYMTDCALHFGAYIHHYPYLGMKDADDRSRAESLFSSTCATIAEAFNINVHDLDATSCGGGCGSSCGGHGCGGHGCGGGHSSCGSGHSDSGSHGGHGTHNDSGDGGFTGCGSSDGGDAERKRQQPPKDDSDQKPGFWRRIFGLSPTEEQAEWYASVTPELFDPTEFRPDVSVLKTMSKSVN
jgi:Glycine-rich domain-containing protein-like